MERTNKSKTKRAEIISAVRQSLPKMDYRTLSVRTICDTCGISIGSFYHHFKNKEDLLTEILEEIDHYLVSEVQPLLAEKDECEKLRIFAFGFALETVNSAFAAGGNVISTSSVPLPSDPFERKKELERPLYQLPFSIIQCGQKSGVFSDAVSAETAVEILITSLRGYAMDWARRSFSYDFPKTIRTFIDFYLLSLKK